MIHIKVTSVYLHHPSGRDERLHPSRWCSEAPSGRHRTVIHTCRGLFFSSVSCESLCDRTPCRNDGEGIQKSFGKLWLQLHLLLGGGGWIWAEISAENQKFSKIYCLVPHKKLKPGKFDFFFFNEPPFTFFFLYKLMHLLTNVCFLILFMKQKVRTDCFGDYCFLFVILFIHS